MLEGGGQEDTGSNWLEVDSLPLGCGLGSSLFLTKSAVCITETDRRVLRYPSMTKQKCCQGTGVHWSIATLKRAESVGNCLTSGCGAKIP